MRDISKVFCLGSVSRKIILTLSHIGIDKSTHLFIAHDLFEFGPAARSSLNKPTMMKSKRICIIKSSNVKRLAEFII